MIDDSQHCGASLAGGPSILILFFSAEKVIFLKPFFYGRPNNMAHQHGPDSMTHPGRIEAAHVAINFVAICKIEIHGDNLTVNL
jgi:hypothetical protein